MEQSSESTTKHESSEIIIDDSENNFVPMEMTKKRGNMNLKSFVTSIPKTEEASN